MKDQLDPQLAELFAAEKARPAPDGAEARVLERLDSSIASGIAPQYPDTLPLEQLSVPTGAAPWLSARSVAWGIGAMGVIGGLAHQASQVAMDGHDPAPVTVVETQTHPQPSEPSSTPVPAVAEENADAVKQARQKRTKQASSTPPPAPVQDRLAEERQIVERARRALSAGDSSSAMAEVQRHAQRFPRGMLSEEREALRIRAVAQMGDKTRAKRMYEQFRKRFARSIFVDSIEAALR